MKYDFTLENVVEEHNEDPRTFRIPDKYEIDELETGDIKFNKNTVLDTFDEVRDF
ncbi:hypothetical protein [Anaeromicropila populeti]|uniref:Uncharacterized protein n=1 Tax=Anaeromicropila populeti TaxID=37658 RepID=A0A1I6IER4_9FIRM|nr:hypothetical protein [Anaeromicropila populeti]SFR65186.1 hypothetical protein SAMN05661086_00773 [Anaeromicropila populeti]